MDLDVPEAEHYRKYLREKLSELLEKKDES
jgi:hypothetical protein